MSQNNKEIETLKNYHRLEENMKIVKEQVEVLKNKNIKFEEERDIERMSLKALEGFLAAEIKHHQETINDMNICLEKLQNHWH